MREGIDDDNDNDGEGDDKENCEFEIWDVDVSTFGVWNGGGVEHLDGNEARPMDADGTWVIGVGGHVVAMLLPQEARDASEGIAAGRALCCFRKERNFSSIEHSVYDTFSLRS